MIGASDTRFPTGQFLALFVPVALVAIVVAFAFRQLRIDIQVEQIISAEQSHLQQLSGFLAAEISFSAHQLNALTREALALTRLCIYFFYLLQLCIPACNR